MKRLSTKEWIAVAVALSFIAVFFLGGMIGGLFKPGSAGSVGSIRQEEMNDTNAEGEVSQPGSVLTVQYVGKLQDGSVFDSSANRGPFTFVVGRGDVIRGWDEGLIGVRKGDVKTLTIPPKDAYGGVQGHPLQNETLIFEIEVVDVRNQ